MTYISQSVHKSKLDQQSMVHHHKLSLFYLYLGVKVTQNVAQYPLHHVTYAPAKFEVAMSNSLGDAFTRKYKMLPCTLHATAKFEVATCKMHLQESTLFELDLMHLQEKTSFG